ncbi:MAG TPA: hypothetical protein PKX38_09700 [Alphaproteobacteria bacterium]|nr:hypothetical protein [Micavibrio sp.]MBK9562146.1 hypothetical protein [Micavibrio sp.]HQX28190.1 hypothetical protein [Alphaproteobacteria bacterium]
MSTDNDNNGISRQDYLARVEAERGPTSVCRNDDIGRRMDSGKGIFGTTGLSPEGCIAFFAENGSIVQELAVKLNGPTLQFNKVAPAPDNDTPSTPTNNGPKFKA